jgi:hypothetical protein
LIKSDWLQEKKLPLTAHVICQWIWGAITGYIVIQAENLQEAEKIAQKCPSITSIRVYEIRSM